MEGLSDLHRHLDGSLRPATFRELAAAIGHDAPADLRFQTGMGLAGALARFSHTLAVLQTPAAVERVAAEICEDAAADGVTTLEIRFAPQLHRGAPPAAIVDAALAGAAGRAGLLLCGLYGEDPAILAGHVELARSRPGVVGVDIAGGPTPGDRWRLADYAGPFRRAAELGLGVTVHAGEGRPPDEIRTAIELLGARRIGHGTTLLGDPTLVDLIRARAVTIEACVTSNVQIGAIARATDHPLARWLDLGVRACICTDNTFFSDVTSSSEVALAGTLPGMTPEKVAQAIANGHAGAFRR
ncbi:MAG: adenosine deaminase [Myxococcales bacterium]|nr:adenosine deaminase [Myxococcales bacterium]